MSEQFNAGNITIGVVGLGLMGSSIVVSLLQAGHCVVAIAPIRGEEKISFVRIKNQLKVCAKDGLLAKPWSFYLSSLTISDDYKDLNGCSIVLECVIEEIDVKVSVYKKIIPCVNTDAIIGSNTSAVPISVLQQFITFPERFIGIHWAEPAFATRFLEIICGTQTSVQTARWVFKLAQHWGKEPTILKKDIRGFIANRLMYAVYREALYLVENGETTLEDADKSFRYDTGSWMTLMGIFRRIDFLGLKDYSVMLKNIFPKLNNHKEVPSLMQHLVDINASGVRSGKGLYDYTMEDTKNWEEAFASFNKDIYQLALLYPSKPINIIKEDL